VQLRGWRTEQEADSEPGFGRQKSPASLFPEMRVVLPRERTFSRRRHWRRDREAVARGEDARVTPESRNWVTKMADLVAQEKYNQTSWEAKD